MKALAILFFISAGGVLAAPLCSQLNNETAQLQLSSSTVTELQLALFLENLEVSFFQSAAANISTADGRYGTTFNDTVNGAVKVPSYVSCALILSNKF